MSHYFNPYSGADFFAFFQLLFLRLIGFLSGKISFGQLASDEVQILALSGIALSCGLVGTFLVLRNMTMLANALSHTLLLGIIGAFILLFSSHSLQNLTTLHLFVASLLSATITALLTEFLTKTIRLQEDASIGLVFTFLFALSIVLVTLFTKNQHIGIDLVMGNVDALKKSELRIVFGVLTLNLLLFFIFFKELKITTFDAGLSKALGFSPMLFNLLLLLLTAVTICSAFRAVGVLMVLAFFVLPPLIARLFIHHLGKLIVSSCVIGVLTSLMGVAFSRHLLSCYGLGLSTGALVVVLLSLIYVLGICAKTASKYAARSALS